jgi:hypothetical protein
MDSPANKEPTMRKSLTRWVAALGLLLVVPGAVSRAGADDAAGAGDAGRAALRTQASSRIQETVEKQMVRPTEPAVLAVEARRIARRLSDAQLQALADGADVQKTIAPSLRLVTGAALGSATSDLTFVPLPPCRIIDTRQSGAGKLLPGVIRDFQVSGVTQFDPQGGNIGGCGVPAGGVEPVAAAVAVNIVAVTPSGSGTVRAWAYGQEVPLAAAITYDNLGPFSSLSNGIVVPIAGTNTVPADLSVRADFNATHFAADVTGYFTRFPVEQFQNTQKSITEVVDGGAVDLSSGLCTEVSSCTITSGAPGKVIVRAWAQIQLSHGTNVGGDRIAVGVKNVDPTNCTNNDQSINATDYEVPDALPPESGIDWTLPHKRIFSQPSGTRTYYINARMITGAGAGDTIQSSRLICTFIPD